MRSSSIGVGPKTTGGCPLRNRKGDDTGGGDGKAVYTGAKQPQARNARSHQALGEAGEEGSAC